MTRFLLAITIFHVSSLHLKRYNGPTYFHQQVEKCSALHFFLLNIDILSLLCVIMSITPIELFLDYFFFHSKDFCADHVTKIHAVSIFI